MTKFWVDVDFFEVQMEIKSNDCSVYIEPPFVDDRASKCGEESRWLVMRKVNSHWNLLPFQWLFALSESFIL